MQRPNPKAFKGREPLEVRLEDERKGRRSPLGVPSKLGGKFVRPVTGIVKERTRCEKKKTKKSNPWTRFEDFSGGADAGESQEPRTGAKGMTEVLEGKLFKEWGGHKAKKLRGFQTSAFGGDQHHVFPQE